MAEGGVLSQNSLKTMQLNDQKAGMQGLDREAINKVIYESSKGTPYFIHQEKRQQRINSQAKEMLEELANMTVSQRKDAAARMDALCATLEVDRDLNHSIVHIDMDAFYAAVEMLDNPDLKLKPMAVGSMSMLSTSNYEARKYGVRAAMPGFIGKKLCQDLIIVPCRFDRYREISKKIRDVIKDYDPDYSPMGLDEVYLDITEYVRKIYNERQLTQELKEVNGSSTQTSSCSSYDGEDSQSQCLFGGLAVDERDKIAFEVVEEIRQKIFDVTQLTASAGIAPNTRLAKVCSDQNKPNGQYQIKSYVEVVKHFVEDLPVKKVSGIGPVQAQLLNQLGIYTCGDMWQKRDVVDLLFSQRSARFYMKVALGIGSTEVKSDYVRKSIGNEQTFQEIHKPEELHQKCEELCDEMIEHMKARDLLGKVVVLKTKNSNFQVHTRNSSFPVYTCDRDMILRSAKKLLDGEIRSVAPQPLKLRLMGLRMANLVHESEIADAKQGKIKDFLCSNNHTQNKTSQAHTTPYTCPVCDMELTCNIKDFNLHVDMCLKKDHVANHTSESSSEKACDNDSETFTAHSPAKSEECPLVKLTCPVCGTNQKSNDLQELNSHIDFCLSRVAIKELLSDDVSTSANISKRKSSPSKCVASKRTKTSNHNLKTLDHYFNK